MFASMSAWIAGIAALIGMHTCAHDVHEGQQLHAQNLTQLQVNLRWHRWKKLLFCLLFDNKILPVDSRSVEDTLMWNVLCFGQRNRMLACPWALWSPVTIPGSKWPKLAFEERGARVSKVVLYIDLLISHLPKIWNTVCLYMRGSVNFVALEWETDFEISELLYYHATF